MCPFQIEVVPLVVKQRCATLKCITMSSLDDVTSLNMLFRVGKFAY